MPVRALALFVVVPLLLAGCSQDVPTPQFQDPTPSATPTASQAPERESARDFIRRWAEAEAEMENTGQTEEYRALSTGCRACADLADLVEKYYRAGGYVHWDGWDIRSVTRRGRSDDPSYLVKVVSAPTTYATRAGGDAKSFPGGKGLHLLTLRPVERGWIVIDKSEVSQ